MYPEVPVSSPPHGEIERILAHLQHVNADQVVSELKSVQTDAKNIKKEVDKNEALLQMHGDKLPDSVEKGATRNRLNNITDVVKRVTVAINTGRVTGDIFTGVPDASKNILLSLCTKLSSIGEIGSINHKNSLFINEIIIRGIEGRLQTSEQLVNAFENIKMLKYPHYHLYSEIADLLRTEAKKRGATEGQLERLMTEEQKKEGRPEMLSKEQIKENGKMIEQLDKNSDGLRNSMRTMIDGLDIGALERSEKGRSIMASTSDPQEQRSLLEKALHNIKTQLIFKLDNLGGASGSRLDAMSGSLQEKAEAVYRANTVKGQITTEDLSGNFDGFERLIDKLNGEGILNPSLYEGLLGLATTLNKNNGILLKFKENFISQNQGKGRLANMALSYITTWTNNDEPLLKVLDNREAFIEHARKNYNAFRNPEDWQNFNRDIRHIFHTMYMGTSSNAKDFWQSTFSELREGMVYKELTTALFNLGDQLKKDYEYGDKNMPNLIKIKDVYAKTESASYEGSSLIGAASITTDKEVNVSLGRAIRAFTYEMLDYKELTQYSHDINALTDAGLGFEKLAEFSARLRQEDVSRLIRNMPGLADAISLYQSNIAHITARSARTFGIDFGRRSLTNDNLDSIGQETLHQLKNISKIRARMEKGELVDDDIIRMVTFASGLSKGVFGSFFGVAGNNHGSVEVTQTRDPDHPEDLRPFLVAKSTGKSSSDRGQEQMWASIDLDQTWVKYQKPRLWQEIRYAFAPRDIMGYKATRKDYWFSHDDISKWAKEGERAFVNGASNEYIDFTKDHCFLKDNMKTLIVDVAQRGGWRLYDYHSQLVYTDKTNPKTGARLIDHHKTIMRLRGMGDTTVKTFIKDLFDANSNIQKDMGLSLEDVAGDIIKENEDYLKKFGWKPGQEIGKNKKAKDALEELLYDKYVFQQIRHTQPSLFIAMETREVIPEDEVRGKRTGDGKFEEGFTFHDQLLDYLVKAYGDQYKEKAWIKTHLLPMYTSALQMTERNEWHKKYEIWKQNEKNGITDLKKDPFDISIEANQFSEAAFDEEENKKSLIKFYAGYRDSIGKTTEGPNQYWLEDEGFIKNLKGFYKKMEYVIKKDRWDHNTVRNKFGNWINLDKDKETLTHRYAKLLKTERAGVDSYISWSCFNLDEFNFETSGNRQTQRAFSEAALWVQKGNQLIDNIFTKAIAKFTMKKVDGDHEFEASVREHFVKLFEELHVVVSNVEDDTSFLYNGKMIMFLVSAMADDRINRIGAIGPAIKGVQRRWDKTQSSFMTDKIPVSDREGATSLDSSSKVEIFINTIGNEGLQMARERDQVTGHGPRRFFGLFSGKPTHKAKSMSIEQLVDVAQVGLKTRLKENFLMPVPIMLFIMALLAKLALDKDKAK